MKWNLSKMNVIFGFFWDLIVRFIRILFFNIFHIKITSENWDKILQFVKFGIVGLSNTMISYIVYITTLLFFQKYNLFLNIDYLVSQIIGFLLSVLWSFYWNRKYVFNTAANDISWGKALLKTYVSYAFTGVFLNGVLSVLWVQIFNISKIVAPIINLFVSVPLNFLLNKFWAFKSR